MRRAAGACFILLVAPGAPALRNFGAPTLRIFGGPDHATRRTTSIKFWALDISGGAGSISSPVLLEHPKNVSECALFFERVFASVADQSPRWLLLSVIGAATRELASREVQQGLLPALVTSREGQPKADLIAKKLRNNFDNRIQRVLAPGGYGNAERIVRRFVDAEFADLENTIRSIDDVVTNEITQAFMEVVEVEVTDRIQTSISEAVQLNTSSAERDLAEILRRADTDGNEVITFDELYELVSGAPLDPLLVPLAREVPVLRTARTATDRWDLRRSRTCVLALTNWHLLIHLH